MGKEKTKSIKVTSKRLPIMVGTFLNEDNDGFQVSINKLKAEKVTNTVGTFLNKDNSEAIVSRYPPINAIGKGYRFVHCPQKLDTSWGILCIKETSTITNSGYNV